MNKLKTIFTTIVMSILLCSTVYAGWGGTYPKPTPTYTYSLPDQYCPGVRNPPRKEVRYTCNAKPGEVIEISMHHPRRGASPVMSDTASLLHTQNISHLPYLRDIREVYASQAGWSSVNNEGDRNGYGNVHLYITIPSAHTWSWTGDAGKPSRTDETLSLKLRSL